MLILLFHSVLIALSAFFGSAAVRRSSYVGTIVLFLVLFIHMVLLALDEKFFHISYTSLFLRDSQGAIVNWPSILFWYGLSFTFSLSILTLRRHQAGRTPNDILAIVSKGLPK